MIPIENIMRIKYITHTYHPIHAHVYKDFQLGIQDVVAHPSTLRDGRGFQNKDLKII